MKFVEILRTYNAMDIAIIKSLLDGENIEYRFLGENFNMLEPMVQPARLNVWHDQVDEARELLSGFKGSFMAVSMPDED
ncbi:MAG TPA: hypothetical protein ENJ10_05020 [Caldithrix abyssi]|uniref:DUF2007 domain-containing protein n=1 Tax=Caldithrix abyssi TaxID=187145 RepID=A0A7V1LM69_CALAY|nr:hypothetical protein [Caldithrix abyssi]